MKKTLKQISVLLLALVMVLSMAVPALAADGTSRVTYKDGFEFTVDDGTQMTDTDLFSSFKDVMPGDTLEQEITIINSCTSCDYVKVYLQAIPHDAEKNPLSEKVQAEIDKDNRNAGDAIAYMEDFLSKLSIEVYKGEVKDGQLLYEGSADTLSDIYLGTFDHGDAATLTVVLEVPGEKFDNEYADRIGEIDWQFSVEKLNYSHETDDKDDEEDETYKVTVKKVWKDGNSASRPESIKVRLTRNGKTYDTVTLSAKNNWRYTWRDLTKASGWEVEEVNVPKGYKVSYDSVGRVFTITNTGNLEQTGQLNWPIPLLAGIGLALIAGGATLLRKGRKNNA